MAHCHQSVMWQAHAVFQLCRQPACAIPGAIAMPMIPLRKARTDIPLRSTSTDPDASLVPPGEWFVEQQPELLKVYRDAQGTAHVADVELVDFLDGLATRQIVFVSWG